VNCISAGPMRTLSSAGVSGFDVLREHAVKKSPLGRVVDPTDLGKNALYLLGDLSSGVTGETIHVDCGYSIIGL
jgi:enoyl-[acyl-carrier protein] reductase I